MEETAKTATITTATLISGTPCQHPERTGKHGRQQDYSRQSKDYRRYPKSSQLLPGPQTQSILRLKSRQGRRTPVARPFGRRCSHFELQLTPALNVGITEDRYPEGLSVQGRRLDIQVFWRIPTSRDYESFPSGQAQCGPVKQRATDHVVAGYRV